MHFLTGTFLAKKSQCAAALNKQEHFHKSLEMLTSNVLLLNSGMPGNCFYYKFTGFTETSPVSGIKFTVSGSTPGSFNVGHSILSSIFNVSSIFQYGHRLLTCSQIVALMMCYCHYKGQKVVYSS